MLLMIKFKRRGEFVS